jgi:TPR repeat protein
MKHNLLISNLIVGSLIFVSSFVWADGWTAQDYSKLSISDMQFEQCRQREKPPYVEVRMAIKNKQYAEALELLGKPERSSPPEVVYLYGKTHYFIAHQKANERLANHPEQSELSEAVKYIDLAAELGFAEAIFDQALLFTAADEPTRKLGLLKQAADKQFIPAMLALAEHYFYATKTFEERTEAQSLIQRAADIDSQAKIVLASYYLHEDTELKNLAGYDKDIDKAISLLYMATTECNAEAAYKLFNLSVSEHKPNNLPEERAQYWLETSARLGYAKAQGDLAEYYYNEIQDGEKAAFWATQAVESGDLKALLTLGKIYYHGKGTEKDLAKALHYYEQAFTIDKDNRLVLNQLGMMYYKGEGSEVDFRKAASFCERAANKGQAGCQYYLGLMYVNGEGVTQDIDTGINWMKKSAAQDFVVAKNWLRENW